MKKIFSLGIVIILLLAVAIVVWGAWLNYSDENKIARRMDSRAVELTAARAEVRDFAPTVELDALRFSSDSIADAVALTEGRIVQWHAAKNDTVAKGQLLLSMMNENIPLRIQQAESAISRPTSARGGCWPAGLHPRRSTRRPRPSTWRPRVPCGRPRPSVTSAWCSRTG